MQGERRTSNVEHRTPSVAHPFDVERSRFEVGRSHCLLLLLLVGTPPCLSADPPRTGSYDIQFTDRSPLSDYDALSKRMGWRLTKSDDIAKSKYTLSEETFDVVVPEDYTGKEPYGLFVWVNAGKNGTVPGGWLPVLAKHKLIVIGARNAGNERLLPARMGVALDAVFNMKSRYSIDEDRIYVGGNSGGGRTAAHLGIAYPDVFSGGMYVIGAMYFRPVPTDDDPKKAYEPRFARPEPKLFKLASEKSRHVLLTGDTDMNRAESHAYFGAMTRDGFEHVSYMQVPGMGHTTPDAEWFEKAIDALDDPAARAAGSKGKKAPARPVLKAPTSKPAATAPAASQPTEPEDIRMLKLAKLYAQNRLFDKARAKLKELLNAYPGTASAKEGEAMLKEIGKE
jgi:predicted esterase